MTDGKPPSQPDGEDGPTLGASETDPEHGAEEMTATSSGGPGMPSINDVAGLEDLYSSTNELGAYQEPAVIDMSRTGGLNEVEVVDTEIDGTEVDEAEIDEAEIDHAEIDEGDGGGEPSGGEARDQSDEDPSPESKSLIRESADEPGAAIEDADSGHEDPSVVPSKLGRSGVFARLVNSANESESSHANTIFEQWPEDDEFDPSLTQRVDPMMAQPRRPSVATPELKLSTEASPVPSVQWSTVVHEPYPLDAHGQRSEPKPISDVPTPLTPEPAVQGPGQPRHRDFSDAVAQAAERRWFWATVSGAAAIVFGVGLVASNLIPNPFGSPSPAGVVAESRQDLEGTDPAAPSSQVESTVDEIDTSSTAGAESTVDSQTSGAESSTVTSSVATTTRRRTTASQTRAPTTARTTTAPTSAPSTAETTTSTSESTSSSDGSSTTDGSTSSSVSTTDSSTTATSESTTSSSDPTTTTTS